MYRKLKKLNMISESYNPEPITCEADKGSGEAKNTLAFLFQQKEALTSRISQKVQDVLGKEYEGASDEVKESILRINENVISNLMR